MRILAIPGSPRKNSSNKAILQFTRTLFPSDSTFILYEGLADLPHFNPDLDGGQVEDSVAQLRHELKIADAVLICTPEYAYGVPGSLKNALDWIVSSGEFMKKPTSVISASPSFMGGDKAFASLTLTLTVMDAHLVEGSSLMIGSVAQKLSETGEVTDSDTITTLKQVVKNLIQAALAQV
ncbi:NADPH-dependent FMN reductase [Cytophagaceae bacterium DM2B3-1]|uniref:NADPH-dependent FMN reductase n=1 Tax=Xanthocytophaga flava TaxID=3048013 RepID=A0ABT7CW53_9BACT|nr:NADPH-dependent FMN reductase [Xanthocytophaga flavus]MDJ1497736.1 NADPH-dependent FMN reductase [Xanthocytophaga flavus]